MKQHNRQGNSILEVMISIVVVGVVITSVAAAIAISLQNTSRAKAKAIGTKFTQEGIEYFRAQRTLMGWETFYSTLEEGGVTPTYCLAALPYSPLGGLDQVPNRPCQLTEFVDLNNLYKRSAVVTLGTINGQPTVTITVSTEWPNGDRTTQSTATIQFQQSQN